MKALVLAPHTDDAELGCGGTIAKLVENGDSVSILVFSDARKSLPVGFDPHTTRFEQQAAAEILGATVEILDFETRTFPAYRQAILEKLVQVRREMEPDLVLMPSRGDCHQDHEVVTNEAQRAFNIRKLLGYSSARKRFFTPTLYVALEQHHIDKKIRAINCYESQEWRGNNSDELAIYEARIFGAQIGAEFAEAFEVYQWIM